MTARRPPPTASISGPAAAPAAGATQCQIRHRSRGGVLYPRLRAIRAVPHQGHRRNAERGALRPGRPAITRHQTDLRIAEHYTDTAGATDHVFGLCHLLGFLFAPRIKGLKDRKLYTIEKHGHVSAARADDWRYDRPRGDHRPVARTHASQAVDRGWRDLPSVILRKLPRRARQCSVARPADARPDRAHAVHAAMVVRPRFARARSCRA